MTTERTPTPEFDRVVLALRKDPGFLRYRIKVLEAQLAEKDATIADLLDRLSETRRTGADA